MASVNMWCSTTKVKQSCLTRGIPMRYESLSGKWDHARAVHYAGLISDFLQVTRKLILKEGKNIFQTDGDIDYIRLRTKKGTEFIITSDREFTICVIQKCNPNLADDDFLDEGVGAGGTAANEKSAAPGGE